MRWMLLLFFACSLGACGLRKKNVEETSVKERHVLQELRTAEKNFENSQVITDSSEITNILLIKLTGKFSYSPTAGFTGEATEVRLMEHTAGVRKMVMKSSSKQATKDSLHKDSQLSVRNAIKQTSVLTWPWPWLLLLLPAIAIYRCRNKIIKFLCPTQ
ncbi:MAG: hypothetical protein EOO42_07170 [Flavobacteriales bacterium]|nr:MAG: hypothetical protein EOO42_07170 [Flavobacteriales bacterium]